MRDDVLLLVLVVVAVGGGVWAAENCATSKRDDRCSNIFQDVTNCRNVTFRPIFQECLVTCGACEAFSCTNPEPESSLNCTALAEQCESPNFGHFMKEKCPATCGKCNVKNGILCRDVETSSVCSSLAPFCNSIDYYDLLTGLCPSTCNRCPNDVNGNTPIGPSDCVDRADNCASNVGRCSMVHYEPLMRRVCAKTCGTCQASYTCRDVHPSCGSWVSRGFCRTYNQDAVRQNCPFSCGVCPNQ